MKKKTKDALFAAGVLGALGFFAYINYMRSHWK